jgi:hypothetical protein
LISTGQLCFWTFLSDIVILHQLASICTQFLLFFCEHSIFAHYRCCCAIQTQFVSHYAKVKIPG